MESTLDVEANMEIQQCLNTLYQQDALKLHRMVDKMLVKYGGISQKDKDDFYSIANQTITEIITAIENPDVERKYDSTKGNFLGYIYKAIHLAIIDNIKYRNASKRSVRVTDEDGEIQYLQPVSLEAPIDKGESLTVGDFLCAQEDGFEILQAIGEDSCLLDEHISRFLDSLTALQKQIVRQIMSGDTASEIQVQLSLTKAQYDAQMREIKSYEHTKFLHRRVVNKAVTTAKEISRKDDRYMSISTTAEKTKDTHFSVASMRKKLHTREWREDHVLQRHADLWNQVAKSELIVDIISGKSLTQIIVSEEIRDGIYYRWLIDGKQRCTNIDDYCNGGFAISKKVQRPILEYQVTCTTEDGEIKYDKNGCPIYETRTFDIRGKRFNQLPDELKDKILDYQIPVMLNLNCDKKEIAYDIARFNRCKPMNKSQNGWTGMDEDDAMLIDSIIRNTQFFKSDFAGSNFPSTQEKSGAIRKIVTESIMIINFIENYKKDFSETCKFLSDESTADVYNDFGYLVERIEKVANEDTAQVFNAKDAKLWFAVFAKCDTYNISDEQFVEFVQAFNNELHTMSVDDKNWESLNQSRDTQSKNMIEAKITYLETLMLQYFDIATEKTVTEFALSGTWTDYVQQFGDTRLVKDKNMSETELTRMALQSAMLVQGKTDTCDSALQEYVNNYCIAAEDADDITCFADMLDDFADRELPDITKLSNKNIPVLISGVAYMMNNNVDEDIFAKQLPVWVMRWSNSAGYTDSVENYNSMMADLHSLQEM